MTTLLENLEAFNRKERFFVFTYSTGNSGFVLSPKFLKELGSKIGQVVPPDAKAYVDYHLDWLHAAVRLATDPDGEGPWPNRGHLSVATGNQEDIDLVVAFETESTTCLVLVEAKAYTGWTNKQLRSKAARLSRIFGLDGTLAGPSIRPLFCLMSPRCPTGLDAKHSWPKWMLAPQPSDGDHCPFAWICLPVPLDRKKVVGCDKDGRPSNHRQHWKVQNVRVKADCA